MLTRSSMRKKVNELVNRTKNLKFTNFEDSESIERKYTKHHQHIHVLLFPELFWKESK